MSIPPSFRRTVVFDTYWRFAAERHRVYERRLRGEPQPWTDDLILRQYKFTNIFRACDRVSQYLIKDVIYNPAASTDAEEMVFRTLLFKLFNSIAAWETLVKAFGIPTWEGFDQQAYAQTLGTAKAAGVKIWNPAYVQNQNYATHLPTKHERYLALLQHMMSTNITSNLQAAGTYKEAYEVLRFYPLHGKSFLPMQHLTDLNYSEVINFDEDDFIVPGPGALDGIRKCWGTIPAKISPSDIIRGCVEDQETFFQAVGEEPVRLFGRRRLHAIGCIPDALPEHIGPFRSTDSERRRSSLQDRYHPSHSFRRSGEFKSRGGPNVDLLRRRRPLY